MNIIHIHKLKLKVFLEIKIILVHTGIASSICLTTISYVILLTI